MSGPAPPRVPYPPGLAGSRRGLVILVVLLVLIVGGFLAVAALYLVARLGGVRADVVDIKQIPPEVYLCVNFHPSQGVLSVASGRQRHLQVTGDCAENTSTLTETYTSELAFRGWTVHTDGSGNLVAFQYAKREALSISMDDSQSQANATTITLDVFTGQDHAPPDFPPVTPSPGSASPQPSPHHT